MLLWRVGSELVRARKWSSDRTINSAWVRAIARKLVIVVIQSGFLLASVQTITLVLWRVEMRTPTTRGTGEKSLRCLCRHPG